MLESIEILREWSHWLDCAYATSDGTSYRIHDAPLVGGMKSCGLLIREKCDEIEAEFSKLQESWAQEAREHADDAGGIADIAAENERLKREIAERYMELPVDADGVPIHVGDELYNGEVIAFGGLAEGGVVFVHRGFVDGNYILEAFASNTTHHVKPRTVEDVLERFKTELLGIWGYALDDDIPDMEDALFAKYADEIRKVVGE